ncbi:MAG: DNA-binding response regulator [Candidatus Muproteobacteria bacterium RIFCSPHIGHO2_02_FULL_65_16]|uniref:DNA-binding response regulator n=1 Tax=Candidatus Muproteobacteria bacterium RIFCSPHIGHO2_02_FULL_65_16 TaxID=1817766 RepID=A0A1F6U0Z9_9PROT|nr:MAG: DNA-binding response regulator [Candidatus Muproteobacteria bacterium RIFCSPHIGHO2_02_FULL_65_16]
MQAEPVVYVVDDDDAIRDSLRLLLRSAGLQAKTFASAQQFLDAYIEPAPGVLLVDVRMPGMSGLELQELLAARKITLPVIIITGHGHVAMAVRAMKVGAADFIEKPFDNEALLECIRKTLARAADARRLQAHGAEAAARLARLTPREREVLELLVAGKSNKAIASDLGISARTVEVHRAKIMEKLDARSLSDVVRISLTS